MAGSVKTSAPANVVEKNTALEDRQNPEKAATTKKVETEKMDRKDARAVTTAARPVVQRSQAKVDVARQAQQREHFSGREPPSTTRTEASQLEKVRQTGPDNHRKAEPSPMSAVSAIPNLDSNAVRARKAADQRAHRHQQAMEQKKIEAESAALLATEQKNRALEEQTAHREMTRKKAVEEAPRPSMVLADLLYISGVKEVAGMDALPFRRFSHVLHCASSRDASTMYPCDHAFLVHVWDEPGVDIARFFPDVIAYIQDAERSSGKQARILVHCKQGISRSVSFVVAYLMQVRRMPLLQCFELLAAVRPQICPNPTFAEQLIEFEKEVFDGRSTLSLDMMKKRGWTPREWDASMLKFRN